MMSKTEELLIRALTEARIFVTDNQLTLLARHLDLVIERNRSINLTRITTLDEAVYLHVVDSLLLLDAFANASDGPFVDMGTGAGFPGIPLAIVTDRPALLVDSVGKKAKAVAEFVDELGISDRVSTAAVRMEHVGEERREAFAVATARAVAQTNVLVEYAAPMLRHGGRLVVAKARPSEEELKAGKRAATLCGMRFVSRETHELPRELGHREILSYERARKPKLSLPRAVGMAKHHPLGA